ncbi:hypothetical protein GHT06_018024 [Daphnia sinensis]|uniref:PAS domain-containing protein n=1 Tax=Daphnia sinensis TaxID=1820382 RepID=A0AAD5PSQ9_9CRUS|nr:hypothetical protein GHT06_018024 [Daphnia sinensis]
MPVRRGHVAPQNSYIETIIRKFDELNRSFVVANALADGGPIIYCNERFCQMVGFSRAEIMQKPAVTEFLHGPLTSPDSINQVREILSSSEEKQIDILYYKKDGTKFMCSQVIAPIKNEAGEVCMYILNFEDCDALPDAPNSAEHSTTVRFSKCNCIFSPINRVVFAFHLCFLSARFYIVSTCNLIATSYDKSNGHKLSFVPSHYHKRV